MKRTVTGLYIALYVFVAGALLIVEVASIKIGWVWLSTLVMPMGWLFLLVNVPVAFIGVIKIGHLVFLHSVKHHKNVMRSIREMDAIPYPTKQNYHIENEDVKQVYHGQGTSETSYRNVPLFQPVSSETPEKESKKDNCNYAVAYYLVDNPGASIRKVSKETGYPIATINRTNAWKDRSR